MKLYEEIIQRWQTLLAAFPVRTLPVQRPGWPDTGGRDMVLRADMAYELGASPLPALGGTAVTVNSTDLTEDQILLCGPDLPDIRQDTPYARLTIADLSGNLPDQGSALYKAVKKIDFVRYHVNPEGFMSRISAIQNRESVRVSRRALESGMDFSRVGSRMLEAYHENPQIRAVRLIYITHPDFPFEELASGIRRCQEITRAIDHAVNVSMTDCNVCSLKKVCDEVEGIRQLHFGQKT